MALWSGGAEIDEWHIDLRLLDLSIMNNTWVYLLLMSFRLFASALNLISPQHDD